MVIYLIIEVEFKLQSSYNKKNIYTYIYIYEKRVIYFALGGTQTHMCTYAVYVPTYLSNMQ